MTDALTDCWWENEAAEEISESDLIETTGNTQVVKKKGDGRKRSNSNMNEEVYAIASPSKRSKKKKSKVKDIDNESGPTPVDLITCMEKSFLPKLSAIEKDEAVITADHFSLCNESKLSPNTFLKLLLPKWSKLKKLLNDKQVKGDPICIVVASSAIRAVSLLRDIHDFRGESCKTAKLFAKHMKVSDQGKFLRENVIHICVGTPSRMKILLDEGLLRTTQMKRIVIDWSFRDCKLRALKDMEDLRTDLFNVMKSHFIPLVRTKSCLLSLM